MPITNVFIAQNFVIASGVCHSAAENVCVCVHGKYGIHSPICSCKMNVWKRALLTETKMKREKKTQM